MKEMSKIKNVFRQLKYYGKLKKKKAQNMQGFRFT